MQVSSGARADTCLIIGFHSISFLAHVFLHTLNALVTLTKSFRYFSGTHKQDLHQPACAFSPPLQLIHCIFDLPRLCIHFKIRNPLLCFVSCNLTKFLLLLLVCLLKIMFCLQIRKGMCLRGHFRFGVVRRAEGGVCSP